MPPPTPRTIVCVGGSATAGGGPEGGMLLSHQYPFVLQQLLHSPEDRVLNMAHGATDTLYAALNFNTLIPPNATHIVWEFAINDPYNIKYLDEYLDQIELFMDMVAQHPRQPTVIFVMLWNTPFSLPPRTSVRDHLRSTLAHELVVDVDDWINQKTCMLRNTCRETSGTTDVPASLLDHRLHSQSMQLGVKADFVVDQHHPTSMVHQYIAQELSKIIQLLSTSTDQHNKRQHRGGFRFRTQGTTFHNRFQRPSRTQSILFDAPNLELYYSTVVKDQPLTLVGKSDINRQDRHRTMRIPSCNEGTNALYLDVVLSFDEQLSLASLGDVEDSMYGQYLHVEYQPEDSGSSAIGFELVSWVFPTEVYRTLRQRFFCLRNRVGVKD